MDVYQCGTLVTITLGQIPGVITAAEIRYETVNYEVSYFINGEYRCGFMHPSNFSVNDNQKPAEKVGFKNPNP